jgi:hypothetical protein
MTARHIVYWLYDDTCKVRHRDGYVGITCHLARRIKEHRWTGRFPEGFKVMILYEGTRDECLAFEKRYRPQPATGWNLCVGGFGGRLHAASSLAKISAASKRRVVTAETCAKISAALKTRVISSETRAKLSAANRRRGGRSSETCAKISAAAKSRSAETCAKISAAKKGKPWSAKRRLALSDETRARISAANQRRWAAHREACEGASPS